MITNGINPGQLRKIHIIEKNFGTNWRVQYAGKAIDAVYNLAIQDDRKSVFCKIDKARKDKLTEMLKHYDATIGEFFGMLVDTQYDQYLQQCSSIVSGIAEDYSG